MFTRHLIAAAALTAVACAANADVISTTNSTMASDLSIVDTSTSLSGADTGLASILASTNTSSQLVLVRGVEGLYMLASRASVTASPAVTTTTVTTTPAASITTTAATSDAVTVAPATAADVVTATAPAVTDSTGTTTPALALDTPGASAPIVAAVDASQVPEPASLTLMLAGVLAAVAFTRARKQG